MFDKNLFQDCKSKGDILKVVFGCNDNNDLLNRSAAEKFLELGLVDDASQFYLLSKQLSNIQTMERISISMSDAFSLNNSASIKMCMAAEENNRASDQMYNASMKNCEAAGAMMSVSQHY